MDVCKCTVPLRHGGTLNNRRAASSLVRLVEGEESYDDGTSDMEDGGHRMTCPPHPDSADIDELSETECDRHHNSWIVIRESFEEDLIRRVPRVC
ncbi:uncharacterized protein TNCV_3410861 [Trichonephila clavipes]|nr:uncharacterized protein TNCV_3410861 [Trichonephila clavipes]